MAPRGAPWGTLVGAIFALGPLPGSSQGARITIFRPSLVNPALDPKLDAEKLPNVAFVKDARTLKIELSLRREINFHIFTNFLPEPKIIDLGSSFGNLLGAIWLPFGLLGLLLGPIGEAQGGFVRLYFSVISWTQF